MKDLLGRESSETLRARIQRMDARWARAETDLDGAMDALGKAVAVASGKETADIRSARARVTEARTALDEVESAMPILQAALADAEAKQAAREQTELERAATIADTEHYKAAAFLDATVSDLADAHRAYMEAQRAADTTRRAAGWPRLPGRPAYFVASAFVHLAPEFAKSLRGTLGSAAFARGGTSRPLARTVEDTRVGVLKEAASDGR